MHPRNLKKQALDIEDGDQLTEQTHYRRKSDYEQPTETNTIRLHWQTFEEFAKQADRMAAFIAEAEPLMDYVRAEIKRNDRKAEMYRKITENVLGAGIFALLSVIGAWAIQRFKLETGVE